MASYVIRSGMIVKAKLTTYYKKKKEKKKKSPSSAEAVNAAW